MSADEQFPRMTVDPETKAIYVYIVDTPIRRTVEYSDELNLDFGDEDVLVGVEILSLVL